MLELRAGFVLQPFPEEVRKQEESHDISNRKLIGFFDYWKQRGGGGAGGGDTAQQELVSHV